MSTTDVQVIHRVALGTWHVVANGGRWEVFGRPFTTREEAEERRDAYLRSLQAKAETPDHDHAVYLAWLKLEDAQRDLILANRHNADPWTMKPLREAVERARFEYDTLTNTPTEG